MVYNKYIGYRLKGDDLIKDSDYFEWSKSNKYSLDYLDNITLGDINSDESLDILDIVLMINMILDSQYGAVADVNEDGFLDILDVVVMVNILIGGLP